jgi:membrane associated rhomboid family serine protease
MLRVTAGLVAANVAFFSMQALVEGFTGAAVLIPANALSGAWWQFLTYMFLHANPSHLVFNMFVLLMFGTAIEAGLGWRKYLFLYMASGIGAALFYIGITGISSIPMLGASGAVFGVLAAYGFMFPGNKIFIPLIPRPIPAIFAIVLLGLAEFLLGAAGLEPGIANFGHLGGLITGVLLMSYWKRTARPRNQKELREFEFFWK